MKLKVLAILLLLAVGGAAVFVAVGGLPRSAAAATTYLTSTAAVADVTNDVAATGTVAAATTWSLLFGEAPTTGTATDSSASGSTPTGTWIVSDVKAKVGDSVTAKQVLATATNPSLAADIVAAKNSLTSAHLQLDAAQTAYDDASGDTAVRQTRISLLNATNAYAQARQDLSDLQKTAARSALAAPAAGIVTAVNVTPGADAPSGAAITIDASTYQVTADVVETDVASVHQGQTAAVSIAAIGADLTGTVTAIAPTATSSSSSSSVVSYAVTINLTAPPATLRSGMTADVTVTTASASGVLAVPAAAIRGTTGNYSVLVLVDGAPQVQPVTVGLMTSALVEVKSGLSAGDVVVTGTSSQQRSTTGTGFGPGGGGFVQGGGGGGGPRFNGGGGG
ncbi:MAG TPA: efflux RND transporter periplasmic adaptor subunit [Candidatus Limnocylindrales bacterium]|jgi:macrolide-specific efflux system membrane fusion protein